MATTEKLKLVILGAGPGGYVAALHAAQHGADVTVVEREEVGGTCLNWGCIPTKALLASTGLLSRMKRSTDLGIDVSGSVEARLDRIMARKDKIVATQVRGIRSLFKAWGVRLVEGQARLAGQNRIEVATSEGETEMLAADGILIATGSRPAEIAGLPVDGRTILSSNEALHLQEVPESLLVVGAGVIGCEFAFIFRELGADVTMVEMMPRALSTEDVDISAVVEREMKKKKIRLLTETSVDGIQQTPDGGVLAELSGGLTLEARKMLVSIGRTVNSGGLALEETGVRLGDRGEILVNDRMQTCVDGIYAAGDVTGGLMLAHVASKEGRVAVDNLLGGDSRMSYDVVPSAVFTHPEVGSVGLREHECRKRNLDVKIGRFSFRSLGKAHAMGEIAGVVKIIADTKTDRVLGAHIVGPHASDLIHEVSTAMEGGLTATHIASAIHAHPTLSEAVLEASEAVEGPSIHSLPE